MLTRKGSKGGICSSNGSQNGTWDLTPPKYRRLSGTKSIESARFAARGASDGGQYGIRCSAVPGFILSTDETHDGNGNAKAQSRSVNN